MPDVVPPQDVARYLGITDLNELEELAVALDLDVEVDDDGQMVAFHTDFVENRELQSLLWELHRERTGHYPGDEDERKRQETAEKSRQTKAKNQRAARKELLRQRVERADRPSSPVRPAPGYGRDTRQPIYDKWVEVDD